MIEKGKIFLIDDDELIVSMLSRVLKKSGYDVQTATHTDGVVEKVKAWSPAVVFLDIRLPKMSGIDVLREMNEQGVRTQVVMLTADDTAETAVETMKLGAVDYLTKPFNVEKIKMVLRNILEKENLRAEVDYLRKVNMGILEPLIIGESSAVQQVKTSIEKMAKASVSSLLITGESGTGKEVFARYAHRLLHDQSKSGFSPFVQINCASLPETLLESELFGHERGAFTDAKDEKKGLFEIAGGGTVLLDEIGEMQLNLQSKLLRVLEQRTVRRVGGSKEIPVDITVISTTNKDLASAVQSGEFRRDLFFRLNTFHIQLPPLRERKNDIPLLVKHFFTALNNGSGTKAAKFTSSAADEILKQYDWPGNVRELRNLIERIVVLETANEILPDHLPDWLKRGQKDTDQRLRAFVLPEEGISLDELEKDLIIQALQRSKNNRTQAAKMLRLSYESFRYQIKKFGLDQ